MTPTLTRLKKPFGTARMVELTGVRYHAWEASPDLRREQAAREALTAFLVRAPVGAERNRATLWLDKVAK